MKPGDIVWIYDPNASPRQRSVEKVGRVNFYLLHDRYPWSIATGHPKDPNDNRYAIRPAEHQARIWKASALKELRSIHVEVRQHDPNVYEIHRLLLPLIERAGLKGSEADR